MPTDHRAKLAAIKRLRPLSPKQLWGIFIF